jgi:hypothetical protein
VAVADYQQPATLIALISQFGQVRVDLRLRTAVRIRRALSAPRRPRP